MKMLDQKSGQKMRIASAAKSGTKVQLLRKNSSTGLRLIMLGIPALILGFALLTQAQAQETATSSTQYVGNNVFVPNAPDRYTVVKGDTLWDISGRFLQKPWRWPEIWQMNKDQIRNPHWIYPGQVIILDKATGTMRLSDDTVKLMPQIRIGNERDAITSIPQDVIEPFLTQPIIVENADMLDAPRIVGAKERVILGRDDITYVGGITDPSVTSYQIFRPAKPLRDPDTNKVIAYQADYLGTAEVIAKGDPTTIRITASPQEIGVGARLVPAVKVGLINYVPHPPEKLISGRIISVYDGVAYAGKNMVVVLNRGKADGLEVGHVLATQVHGRTITDKTNGSSQTIKLPDERSGLMFVFRVFNNVSYALITSSTEPIVVGDVFTQP